MVFKKTVKRMAALGTGAMFVGSSVLGAYAADLSQYPAQYIKDGKFTGVMVVGDNAKADDVIGVNDIGISLQAAAVKKVSSAGSSVSASGSAWKVGTSTKTLELSENPLTLNEETIGDIVSGSFIDDSEMPDLLANGEVSNSKGNSPYQQRLYFESTDTGRVYYVESTESDMTGDHLVFDNGEQLARYELEFTSAFETDVDGTNLEDFEDAEIVMLGKTYTIVTATRAGANQVALTLMGGSNRDTLLESNTKTYNIDGKEYEVTLTYVDDDEAQFIVNGETTQKLEDGETDKLADGTTIGVSEILYQDYAGGIHSATFFLGAQKVELTDTNIANSASSTELEVDDESIDGVDVVIEGTDSTTEVQIDSISINMTAQDTYYVPAGGKLSENPDLDEKDLLFTQNWDIEYAGLTKPASTMISIEANGDDSYDLQFVDGAGNEVKVPLAYAASATTVDVKDNDDNFHVVENSSIDTDDYFVITDYTDDAGERKSYVLRYESADSLTDDNPVIRFKDIGSGETVERTLSAGSQVAGVNSASNLIGPNGDNTTNINEVAQIKLGGGTFRVYNLSSTSSDDFNILVDMDGRNSPAAVAGGNVDGVHNTVLFENKDGAQIAIADIGNTINVNISTPNNDDTESLDSPAVIGYSISAASSEVDLTEAGPLTLLSPEDDDDNDYGYTSYGAWVKQNNPTGSEPDELWVDYPADQRVPQVFITGVGASFSEEMAGDGDSVVVQKISVGATKLASEVADITAVNSIIVGGPCANAAAAVVMGSPADCAAGFEPGVGKINLYTVGNNNVAMVVAGYSALDTRNAAQVVANYGSHKGKLTGTAVEVRKVNNQLTVAAPTPKAAMADDEEEAAMEDDSEESAE